MNDETHLQKQKNLIAVQLRSVLLITVDGTHSDGIQRGEKK